MGRNTERLKSACVFCGSSEAADPAFLDAARTLGRALAEARVKLVYGGGGVGLMGATARAAHAAGGEVLGIIPHFLVGRERAFEDVEHIVVQSMHERKSLMFERSDSFVILPGGIGTLEEVVELLFDLFQHTVDENLTPPEFMDAWIAVERIEDVVPALLGEGPGNGGSAEVVARLS